MTRKITAQPSLPRAGGLPTPGSAVLVCAFVLCIPALAPCGIEFHVSPAGDNADPGTRAKPFASIPRAQHAVRSVKKKGLPEEGVKIWLRGGTHFLTQPLVFTPADSGAPDCPITYSAVTGETPIISGGRRISGWKKGAQGAWTARIPDVKAGKWYFEEMFVNGERATLAREPDRGFYRVVRAGPDNHRTFYFGEGHIRKYGKYTQAAVVLLSEWNTSRIRIADIDLQRKLVSFAYRRGKHPRDKYRVTGFEPHPPYFVENAIELLDTPGEWHLDRDTGELTYMPLQDEDMSRAEVIAPVVDPLLRFEGDGPGSDFVSDLVFEGITFAHCASLVDLPRYAASQAGHHLRVNDERGRLDAAVRLKAAHRCRFRRCRFEHLGGTAIHIESWCVTNTVEACEIRDCGGSGIMIGWSGHQAEPVARGNRVTDCLIHDCGRRFFGAIGVWAGITDGTVIAHNEIFNLPYTGVSVGWRWNPQPTPCANNRVEFNHIHHVMQMLSDGGGIYTLGRQPGTVLRGNYIHDVVSHHSRKLAHGLYNDMGSSCITNTGNAVHRVSANCLLLHRAEQITLRNNVFVGGPAHEIIRYAHADRKTITLEDNTLVRAGEDTVPRIVEGGPRGRALQCGGSSFLRARHTAALDPTNLTVEAWVRLERYSAGKDPRRWIVGKNMHEWHDGHYGIYVAGDRAGAVLNIGGTRENVFTVSAAGARLGLRTWHHLVLTYDGRAARFYFDGKVDGKRLIQRKRAPGNGVLTIGKRPDGMARFDFDGCVDEVALYARALSAEEVVARCRAHDSARVPGLVKRWSFEATPSDGLPAGVRAIADKAGRRP